ncbi:hypothetical protein [Streptomyces hypolithicus]
MPASCCPVPRAVRRGAPTVLVVLTVFLAVVTGAVLGGSGCLTGRTATAPAVEVAGGGVGGVTGGGAGGAEGQPSDAADSEVRGAGESTRGGRGRARVGSGSRGRAAGAVTSYRRTPISQRVAGPRGGVAPVTAVRGVVLRC